jgi:hypothetical protein
MCNKRLRQDEIREAGEEQHQTIKCDRPESIVIFAAPSCGDWGKREPEQRMQVGPEDRSEVFVTSFTSITELLESAS